MRGRKNVTAYRQTDVSRLAGFTSTDFSLPGAAHPGWGFAFPLENLLDFLELRWVSGFHVLKEFNI